MNERAAESVLGQLSTGMWLRSRLSGASHAAPCSAGASIPAASETTLFQLLVLNVVLQLFDGVATYNGLRLGVQEWNPLLCGSFVLLGVGPSLLLAKGLACVLLLLVYWAAGLQRATRALYVLAGVYCACSLVPWLAMFLVALRPMV